MYSIEKNASQTTIVQSFGKKVQVFRKLWWIEKLVTTQKMAHFALGPPNFLQHPLSNEKKKFHEKWKKKEDSRTGIRTPVTTVRAWDPNQLDYAGIHVVVVVSGI